MKTNIYRIYNNSLMQSFMEVPLRIYEKGKIPPSANCSDLFTPLNPSLRHIRFANFVAIHNGIPAGRITASVDSLNPRTGEGFWGCFECFDRPEIASALIDAAAEWLKNEKKTVMIGPATLNTNQSVGLLIKGFEHPVQKEINYNPPYYEKLVEGCGLEKIHDLESFRWSLPETLPGEMERTIPIPGLIIRPVKYGALMREANILRDFHNTAMSEMWGFIPVSLSDSVGFIMSLAARVPPELFIIAEVDNRLAGLLLSIPYRINSGKGFIRHAIGGIMPDFRHRGIHLIVLQESYRQCKRLGLTEGEGSQVAESNKAVKRSVLNPIFGGEITKIHRVYQKVL
ncbi:MAG: GNAT family N-acetyltransferase [Desulfocucumaceae bacterium]